MELWVQAVGLLPELLSGRGVQNEFVFKTQRMGKTTYT